MMALCGAAWAQLDDFRTLHPRGLEPTDLYKRASTSQLVIVGTVVQQATVQHRMTKICLHEEFRIVEIARSFEEFIDRLQIDPDMI